MPTASIGVPTMGGVQNSLMNYAVGIGAGLLYDVVRGFTGSGLIGGALSASITGAAVRGVAGEMGAVSSGFAVGQTGLVGLGLGGLLPTTNGENGENGDPADDLLLEEPTI